MYIMYTPIVNIRRRGLLLASLKSITKLGILHKIYQLYKCKLNYESSYVSTELLNATITYRNMKTP